MPHDTGTVEHALVAQEVALVLAHTLLLPQALALPRALALAPAQAVALAQALALALPRLPPRPMCPSGCRKAHSAHTRRSCSQHSRLPLR